MRGNTRENKTKVLLADPCRTTLGLYNVYFLNRRFMNQ
jgi:hypothetical protein